MIENYVVAVLIALFIYDMFAFLTSRLRFFAKRLFDTKMISKLNLKN